MKYDPAKPGRSVYSLIWIDAPAVVNGLTIAELHRTESVWPAATIFVESGAIVKSLQLTQATILNRTPGPLDLLVNRGTITHLSLSQVRVETPTGPARGAVVRNSGKIEDQNFQQLSAVNSAIEIMEKLNKP